ncbi:hypothetical protein RAS1_39430 [Phycisphaerae bacterium RAS1]|nr:hypothetical protein RAS1_39430 [Phycisphaerae bacterium RAS1]
MRNTGKFGVVAMAAMVSLATIGGCPGSDARTSNQGGGSLLSAGSKVLNDQLSSLNADEVQLATDVILSQPDSVIAPLSDEQAQAIVNILADNNLNSLDDIQNAIDNPDQFNISDEDQKVLEALGEGLQSA